MSNHRVENSEEWASMGEAIIEEDEIELNVFQMYQCSICGFKDVSKSRVKAHIRNNHCILK